MPSILFIDTLICSVTISSRTRSIQTRELYYGLLFWPGVAVCFYLHLSLHSACRRTVCFHFEAGDPLSATYSTLRRDTSYSCVSFFSQCQILIVAASSRSNSSHLHLPRATSPSLPQILFINLCEFCKPLFREIFLN